jgi:hypothetical protein
MVDVNTLSGTSAAGILSIILGAMLFFTIVFFVIWIYTSLAFMAIGKKAGLKTPGLAWIPGVGPLIIAFQISEMDWWPWLFFIGLVIPFINFIAMIGIMVFAVIWQWKMFEKLGKPGWWSILCLISPLNLIFWGIAAWSD